MKPFVLDERLKSDCHLLGELDLSLLLLMNNSLTPWFILVPRTDEIELCRLTQELQLILLGEINLISRFIQEAFIPDKLNVASIGNIVQQMHVHIVGRRRKDFCWPNVVWGAEGKELYPPDEIERITQLLCRHLGEAFHRAAAI